MNSFFNCESSELDNLQQTVQFRQLFLLAFLARLQLCRFEQHKRVLRALRLRRKRLLSAPQVAHARKLIGQGEGPDDVAQSLNVSR